MLDRNVPVRIVITAISAARGIELEELAELLNDGWMLLDIMPIRRELTGQEKLTNPQIPTNVSHISEPAIIFTKLEAATSPLPDRAVEPGVN